MNRLDIFSAYFAPSTFNLGSMDDDLPEYSQILVNAYNKQKLVDPQYSIRRFAKDINIHPAVLSLAMKGKRFLAPNDVEAAMKFLEMSFEESMLFVKSSYLKAQ